MAQSQYATEAQLISLSITQAAATRFGSTAMDAALQAASSIADSYINSVFILPLTDWDMSLRIHVCNIAAYLLYCQVGFNPAAPADKLIEMRYQKALEWLQSISDEKVTPNWTDSSGADPQSQAAGPFVISDPPVGFTTRGLTNGICGAWPWWNQ